ncbi:hypothetical protein CJF32_00005571 [Rutstroemia sp. NJR-2017a WRK4]|nr:hypothetical protein CJF32_00005571 [Rutstroemia sp. NJR-2017a WRK4]
MRRSLLTAILSAPAATVFAFEQAIGDGCVQGNFKDLVIRNSCGDDLSIAKCLTSDVDLRSLDQIEQCFIAGGCDAIDSTISAVWFSYECNAYEAPMEEVMGDDLRKRATESSESASTTETSTTKASTSTAKTTSAETTTSASSTSASTASSTSASTSSASASTSSTSATVASTSASTTTSASSTSATTTSSGSSSTGTSLVCSTTTLISTSVCSYGTGKSTGVTIGCTPTTSPSSTCADGMLCVTQSGESACLVKQDSLTTSGLAVTLVFAVGITAFIIGLLVVNYQDRAATKKRQAAHIAMLEAESREALQNMERKRTAPRQAAAPGQSDADLPLIDRHDH